MNTWVAVFLGGGAGSIVRFGISKAVIAMQLKSAFPFATLISNLLASVLLAWLVLRFGVLQPGREHWQALLAIGFCGGFSTLSTFSMENYTMLRDGMIGMALLNIVVSVALGILVFQLFARSA
ncbi:MAG TPA: CrcB family protein [Flavobacteriales bacterium]|nr:CrcB family protein [Flavobacteriales bacterium]